MSKSQEQQRAMFTGYDERCGYCQCDEAHSVAVHDAEVRSRIADEGKRYDALMRAARRQYDQP